MDLTMTTATKIDFLYLSEQDMIAAGVTDMPACVDTMEEMFALLHHGDYRMAGANNDSHGAMVMFPEDRPSLTCRAPGPTAASWPCPPIWAATSARRA
jgi:ornithine cyclodeaminase